MFYVLGPSFALDVNESVRLRAQKVNHDKGRLVAWLIQKRIILRFDASAGKVANRTEMLLVWIMLALAGNLDVAWRKLTLLRVSCGRALVGFRPPTVDLICVGSTARGISSSTHLVGYKTAVCLQWNLPDST